MNNKIDSDVICPFYKYHSRAEKVYSVTCEPLMDPKRLGFDYVQRTGFKRRDDFMDYIELFCSDLYTECPVYKAKIMNMELEEKDKAKLKNGGGNRRRRRTR